MRKSVEDRRQDILEAALTVFAQKGFNGSTTAEIARAAGVAEGTIFRHFATKKELLIAVLKPKVLEGIIYLDKEQREASPLEFFRSFLKNRLELLKENDSLFRFMFAEAQYHEEVREALYKGILEQGICIVKPWFDKGVEQGIFKPLPFIFMVRSFMGMALFYGIFNHVFPGLSPEKTIDEASDQILELFLHGLLVK
ncbi:transcriptional regulator [Desulfosporosinus orientis DSM 765]|uniref:Transcriptional regulator n=1 Tax=Desulfosporosinus orientis (strain ATCC 19365 / DSM 765 / NCIMB 8382 / VKM B-1628 / Singapore I) TaxID=768706 RepID=G7W5A5_DESOD|nr:TetR/AcrR family transcriptional regulator [Desulfosporosinus orientis]AET66333.1 transcriptional regulator [Desulfosporosinus orientis DSM 765]